MTVSPANLASDNRRMNRTTTRRPRTRRPVRATTREARTQRSFDGVLASYIRELATAGSASTRS